MNGRRGQRGFTLIELMIVVAIIGVLSSVAMPVLQRLTLRSKSAERVEIMGRIKSGVADYYLRTGSTRLPDMVTQLEGDPQPPGAPGPTKRAPNFRDLADGWSQIFERAEGIEGALFYQYSFSTDDSVDPPTLLITATGDLDGDGNFNTWWTLFSRYQGVYQVLDPATEEFQPDTPF